MAELQLDDPGNSFLRVYPVFLEFTSFVVGRGDKFWFWEDGRGMSLFLYYSSVV